MRVIHILRDGSTVSDISGRMIKGNEFDLIYHVIRDINGRRAKTGGTNYGKNNYIGRISKSS